MKLFRREETNAFMPFALLGDFWGNLVDLVCVELSGSVRSIAAHFNLPVFAPTPQGAVVHAQFKGGFFGVVNTLKTHGDYHTLPVPALSRYFIFPLAYPTLPHVSLGYVQTKNKGAA